jgi:hypothetical protein
MCDASNGNSSHKCAESSVIAAYQVTAHLLTNEGQVIWRRTSVFIAVNALVAAALQYYGGIPDALAMLVSLTGLAYCISWHYSMGRSWQYYRFYHALMREHEVELGLNRLGPSSRGLPICTGTADVVGGESIKFPPLHMLFKARTLADATTWLFFIVYLLLSVVFFAKLLKG